MNDSEKSIQTPNDGNAVKGKAETQTEEIDMAALQEAAEQHDSILDLAQKLESMLQTQCLSEDYIRRMLGLPPQDPDRIALAYTKTANILNPKGDITKSLLESFRFSSWWGGWSAQFLLVVPPATTDKISPASYAAANLYQNLSKKYGQVTIATFIEKDIAQSDEGQSPGFCEASYSSSSADIVLGAA
ncbi:hypothetical protein M409DRAFT_21075 [Zasmidium cellare ATCC 36951]|uniref:Uncharacterized protein n=1 Tax=Zasmidium cellare ATCC 36951 TaxID=1080233 RepID=A0A6A6CUB5_ZASCE|nr:uncharacterized protein M409DRAFT_21075 [Zasmidium cellare ATCC 36951]KAF2169066.1 hypothetical protein M409DRAFT_21075 [Zasmidium cellare ATCC 36951]